MRLQQSSQIYNTCKRHKFLLYGNKALLVGVLGICLKRMVGASGFEPPTSWSRTRRASQAALRPELCCRCCNSLRWIDTTRNRKVQTITNARTRQSGEVQLHLIYVTPAPILA